MKKNFLFTLVLLFALSAMSQNNNDGNAALFSGETVGTGDAFTITTKYN